MEEMEMKKNVLKEIMDLMDAREGDKLKKHPKLVAAKIEVEKKPEVSMMDDVEEKAESPFEEKAESDAGGEISKEDLMKLLEHLQGA